MRAGGTNPRDGAPRDARVSKVDCLVGGVVVTYQEIASMVKRCTERRQEWYNMVYPEARPYDMAQRARSLEAHYHRKIHPIPREPHATAPLNFERLGSLWKEMRMSNPGAIASSDLVAHVRNSHKYRNGVAHSRRTRGDSAVRNDMLRKTYDRGMLEEYLAHTQSTLGHMRLLYAHLRLVPMG